MKIEIIAQNVDDALEAEKAGADRLELVTAIEEGGLTPSYQTIKEVVESVEIPVYVMVRPHSKHFNYTDNEWYTIQENIIVIRELKAQGIVFGCLNEDRGIDEKLLEKVLKVAEGLGVTFHRAFDEVIDQEQAYKVLCSYSDVIERVLTSGGAEKVPQGIEALKRLIQCSQNLKGPKILVGSGLNPDNLGAIHTALQAEEYHFGSGVRQSFSFHHPIVPFKMERITRILK
ncbi:copper homeostasis protein CutC [Pullulanibacillus camelliae]|uniref:PF03932 family protein CutC n=1 Tax=Pullulanibacillus camelliae TaxID=1707096 RepID=A0A8J2YET6_9BACL|nr:copper homeostasis protein CutC [Pullulanibacillus camelliae]GGE27405.1 copper homeostasis protein CutC [Pullulanibacillus camelliae]